MTYGIAGDRDGNGWWMGVNDDIIVRGDGATGKVTEIKLPVQHPAQVPRPLIRGNQDGNFRLGHDELPLPGAEPCSLPPRVLARHRCGGI